MPRAGGFPHCNRASGHNSLAYMWSTWYGIAVLLSGVLWVVRGLAGDLHASGWCWTKLRHYLKADGLLQRSKKNGWNGHQRYSLRLRWPESSRHLLGFLVVWVRVDESSLVQRTRNLQKAIFGHQPHHPNDLFGIQDGTVALEYHLTVFLHGLVVEDTASVATQVVVDCSHRTP